MELLALILLFLAQLAGSQREPTTPDPLAIHCRIHAQSGCGEESPPDAPRSAASPRALDARPAPSAAQARQG